MKCNEEEKSLSPEAFSKVSLTNLRRSAVPDLSSDLGMNIFKKVSIRLTSQQFRKPEGHVTLNLSQDAGVEKGENISF